MHQLAEVTTSMTKWQKKILTEAGIQRKKRVKAPKSNENQVIRQQKSLQKLRRDLFVPSKDLEIIIDDE
jgi:hypothetical protein